MADEPCYVTVVFKGGERTSVWMSRATLDEFTSDFVNSNVHSFDRKVYPLVSMPSSDSPTPSKLGVTLAEIAYIS